MMATITKKKLKAIETAKNKAKKLAQEPFEKGKNLKVSRLRCVGTVE